MSNSKQQQRRIQVELPSDLEATYANFVLITHSPSEMIMDFARVLPSVPKAKVYGRIIMTPMNAKLLLRALNENLEKFEDQFGEIRLTDQSNSFGEGRPLGF